MGEKCKVSVLCTAYNHEKYIRDALEGFVSQRTDFPFEVLVNDDCSSDGTADIIREYAGKYPNIIRPFYQEKNLYSQGGMTHLFASVFYPNAHGEYMALCEGDDYWPDPEKLQRQVSFLYDRGRLYRRYNQNLLFHGCVPMTMDGAFREVEIEGVKRSGRDLMDVLDAIARRAYFEGDAKAIDFMWYLWCAEYSPLCGRRIKTFQRYFTEDEAAWKEPRDPYYLFANQEEACTRLLAEFGLTDAQSRIINGHTPIRVTHGESPIKAGGKCIVIDGGFCRAYQKTTGIAGYTLISNSHGMRIVSHQPFTDLEDALSENRDIHSQPYIFATWEKRRMVADTDRGHQLQERIADLHDLLEAVRQGLVNLKS